MARARTSACASSAVDGACQQVTVAASVSQNDPIAADPVAAGPVAADPPQLPPALAAAAAGVAIDPFWMGGDRSIASKASVSANGLLQKLPALAAAVVGCLPAVGCPPAAAVGAPLQASVAHGLGSCGWWCAAVAVASAGLARNGAHSRLKLRCPLTRERCARPSSGTEREGSAVGVAGSGSTDGNSSGT